MSRWKKNSLVLVVAALAASVAAQPISRSRTEVLAFRSENPCPRTGQVKGPCSGWHVDHIIPLCAGGLDHRSNMQWISREDHAFKTRIDVRECRKLTRAANTPAN